MVFIGQRVDHRDVAVFDQGFELFLAEGTHDEAVRVAGQHAGGVLERFAAAELRVAGRNEDRVAAELAHAHFEGHAGPRGSLFENQQQGLPRQEIGPDLVVLHLLGPKKNLPGLIPGDIQNGQKMLGHRTFTPSSSANI